MTTAAPTDIYAGRIHGLDAYRGVLMSLGIVLHTALFFVSNEAGGWGRMPFSNWALPIMWSTHTIHLFRMPAFFALSGFFGALLWQRRGVRGTIQNRFERLFLPLVVLAVMLQPLLPASFELASAYVDGRSNVFGAAVDTFTGASWLPGLWHLWFLNYLVWIVALTIPLVVALGRWWPARWSPSALVRAGVERPWLGLAVVGALNAAWWGGFGWLEVPTVGEWLPGPILLAYYWGCYLMGWLVFVARPDLSVLREQGGRLLGLGLAMSVGKALIMLPLLELRWDPRTPFPEELAWTWPIIIVLGAVGAVALSIGLAGFFLKVAGEASSRWRELSDGSYWIYIIHMVLVAPLAAPLAGLPVPAPLLAIAAIVAVFLACWWSYLALVRWTAIGAFLNGRRYPSPTRLRSLGALVGLGLVWLALGAVLHEASAEVSQGSPWRDAADPVELLADHTVQSPYTTDPPGVPEVRLDRCIGVDDYILCPDGANWHGAVLGCEALGGALITLPTQEAADALWPIVSALTTHPMMVSVSDGVQEGRWLWLDGSELDYSPWAPGEPNNHQRPEGCAMLNYGESEGWHDLPCDEHIGFICSRADSLAQGG